MSRNRALRFLEFFAGGGMARLGLGAGWSCAFANDFDPVKVATYRANFEDAEQHLRAGDVWALDAGDLPRGGDLAWASSPCQDFSLAGGRAGLAGGKSSAFFGFWRLIEALGRDAPRAVVIENVSGLLTSHGGADFTALCAALAGQGYSFGALEIDAARFVPQSRPRVFVIATRTPPPDQLVGDSPFQTRLVREAQARLPADLAARWIWWRGEAPATRNTDLASLLEPDDAVAWHSAARTTRLIELMSPLHQRRLAAAQASGVRQVGAVFKRMRVEDGVRVQRAEARFDGLAGCLRTPRGGSSRQTLIVTEGQIVRSRLVTAREAARLMGLPETYQTPSSATSALHVMGDGVVVPVVRWLAAAILEPLLTPTQSVLAAE
ncbi:DNA cytosine methyltransferase [Phenylobacterium sp.]|uniref:DNA cytosine methyltransferase n=1 Tax=Phenylobacterium sp. TaxID=1871053 RepID=UPI0027333192|nr:DNA cytosine methyltransferase [Phenylobacterium sp.]MDP3852957.1 DNA cytosine methyltransferase [Phenylobacterium sp.]